jgi:excisionase family DNA binding protein
MQVKIEGLEDEVRRIVADVLAQRGSADEWYTTESAATYLGTTAGHIRNLVSEGRLPRRGKRGHKIMLRRSDLDSYAEGKARS